MLTIWSTIVSLVFTILLIVDSVTNEKVDKNYAVTVTLMNLVAIVHMDVVGKIGKIPTSQSS